MNPCCVVLCLILLFCACAQEGGNVLRLGYLQSDLHHLPAFVALEKGYFTQQGLQVQVGGVFKAGPEEMSAFGSGDLDFGYVGQAPATAALLNGAADIRFIAQVNLEGSAIVARKGSGIDSVKGLTGRLVAFPGHATMQDFLLRRAVKNSLMSYQDIRPIVLKPPEMLQALEQKNIDAFIAWEPYPAQALQSAEAKVVLYSGAILKDHPCCVLIASRALCETQPHTVKKIQAAHAQACAFITEHPDDAATIGIKYTSMERAVVEQALKHCIYTSRLDKAKALEFVEFLKELRYVKPDGVDQRFTKAFFD
jgi:NitT/TauT family transport system substrate-binding protein